MAAVVAMPLREPLQLRCARLGVLDAVETTHGKDRALAFDDDFALSFHHAHYRELLGPKAVQIRA